LVSDENTIETSQVVDASLSCSVLEILADTCSYRVDGVCDAGTFLCPYYYSDCIDCDPCRALHGSSCSSCTNDPSCAYCEGIDVITQTSFAVCTTVELSEVIPGYCWILSGNVGDFDGTTFAFGTTNCTDVDDGDGTTSYTCNLVTDSCATTYNGVCNAVGDSPTCTTGSDCFDCDPCASIVADAINNSITDSNEICQSCTASGCQYCTYPSLDGGLVALCTSPSIATTLSDLCLNLGGSPYTSTCGGTGEAPAPAPTNTNIGSYTCDYSNDSCPFAQDKECDTGSTTFFSGYCSDNSDCVDCDPCQALRFQGCDTCVAAGCYWCASDALCLSTNPSIMQNETTPRQLTCTSPGDFVQTCPTTDSTNVFSDPLYDAQNWVYEQIGVVDVWRSGISTFIPIVS
jgi:hypothetical protein